MFNQQQQDQNATMLEMDIQREEILAFFRDYWKPILGFAVFLVLLTAGIQIYRGVESDTGAKQTAQMMPLISAPVTAENTKAIEDFAIKEATGKRKALALLYAAGKYQTLNQPDDAKRVLQMVVDSSATDNLKDYARILLANMQPGNQADKVRTDSVWHAAASELAALSTKDADEQRKIYGEIANDKTAPTAMRKRAAEFSGEALD